MPRHTFCHPVGKEREEYEHTGRQRTPGRSRAHRNSRWAFSGYQVLVAL